MDKAQHYGLAVTTAPTWEPLSPDELRDHLRLSTQDEDALVQTYAKAARIAAEKLTGRAIPRQTLRLTLDRFPAWTLTLPRPPLAAVTAVTYVDADGATQTLSSTLYRVDTASEPGRVEPAYGQVWPTTQAVAGAVNVTYTAGYASAATVPETLKTAMLLMVGHWYMNREQVVLGSAPASLPFGAETLCLAEWTGEYR